MKTYRGHRDSDGAFVTVTVCGKGITSEHAVQRSGPLRQRHDLRNHSPDGFEWGYGGSGPAQLALALLADALGDDSLALRWYQDFKWKVVAPLDRDAPWEMTDETIRQWARTVGVIL